MRSPTATKGGYTDMALRSDSPRVAIVGITRETASLLGALIDAGKVQVVRILNPRVEDLADLLNVRYLDVIVNASDDADVADRLRSMDLGEVDVVGALSARILFLAERSALVSGKGAAERRSILDSLHEIRQAILLSNNREELLKLVLTVAARSVGADTGSIMLLDSRKRYLKIEMADGIEPDVVTSTVQKVGTGVAGRVVKTRKPVLLKGAVGKDRKGPGYDRADRSSSICCPLIIGDEAVGVISVNAGKGSRSFDEEDLAYMQRLAVFTADIIRTSTVYERTTQTTFSLSLLDDIRTILNRTEAFDERLNLLLLKVVNTFGGEICNYYVFNRESRSFIVKASSSFRVGLLAGKTLKLNDYLARKALQDNGSVCLDVADKDSKGKKWYLAEPVETEEGLVGLLFLHVVSERDRLGSEVDMLKKIAGLLSVELGKTMEQERLRIQSVKFSAISEASFDLAGASTMEELGRIAVTNGCLILEAESAVLRLLDEHGGPPRVLDSFSLRGRERLKALETFDAAVAREAIEARDVLLVNDAQGLKRFGGNPAEVRSAMSMCLSRDGRRIGTLSLYDKKTLDLYGALRFSSGDREVFLNYALQAAKAFGRFLHRSGA